MVSYDATIRSRHPSQRVFAYLAYFANAVQWDPGISEAERFVTGRKGKLTYEMTEFTQSRRFTVKADNGGFSSEDTVSIQPSIDGCNVHYHATLNFSGVGSLLTPIWWLVFRRIGSKAAAGLADWLHRDEFDRPSPDE